ncbi:MAG: hypothetical protein RLZZ458_2577 [Planctomycetota bacterium]
MSISSGEVSRRDPREFRGLTFGITISVPNQMFAGIAYDDTDVNQLTFQEASYFLREGGRVVLGHRWKPEGVMHHLASQVKLSRLWRRIDTVSGQGSQSPNVPDILNVIAWNDQPPSEADIEACRLIKEGVLSVEQVMPPGIDVTDVDPNSNLGKFCRIRALTAMRQRITELSDVRICLGGGNNRPERRLSGVLEEALLAIQAGKPLFVASAMGGVSKVIADAILQRKISPEDQQHFYTPEAARDIMLEFAEQYSFSAEHGPSIQGHPGQFHTDVQETLRSLSVPELASVARLDVDDYLTLLTTADLDYALTLITRAARVISREKNADRSQL